MCRFAEKRSSFAPNTGTDTEACICPGIFFFLSFYDRAKIIFAIAFFEPVCYTDVESLIATVFGQLRKGIC